MDYLIEIAISILLISYVLFESFRIVLLKNDRNSLYAGLASMLAIAFGLYLIIKVGVVLDYGIPTDILSSKSELIYNFGAASLLIGFSFILFSLIRFLVAEIKLKLNGIGK